MIPWSDTVEPASWVVAALRQRSGAVSAVVPPVFDRYVRVSTDDLSHEEQASSVVEVLRRVSKHTSFNVDHCWFALATVYGWVGQEPGGGSTFTLTDDDRAAYSEDRDSFLNSLSADVEAGRRGARARYRYPHPLVIAETRDYMLYEGKVEDALAVGASGGPVPVADLWWPVDRMWFVGGDTDLHHELYVGGPAELINELHAIESLNVKDVSVEDREA